MGRQFDSDSWLHFIESNPCVKNYTLVRLYVINQTVSKLNDHETHLNQTKWLTRCDSGAVYVQGRFALDLLLRVVSPIAINSVNIKIRVESIDFYWISCEFEHGL